MAPALSSQAVHFCKQAIKPSSPFQRMKPEIERNQLKWFLHAVATNAHLELVGIHCDFRSHMAQEDSFWDAALTIREVVLTSRAMGLDPKHLHLGGGQDVMDCSEKGRTPWIHANVNVSMDE